ncbi:MAG: hypothetical protein LBC63_04650 [Holophagales bacterium]|nr:hypothetical protein [Holophagales bacterium]
MTTTASQAVAAARQILDLSEQDRAKINGIGRGAPSALKIHQSFMEYPIATPSFLTRKTGLAPATVNKALGCLERAGIVKKLTAQKRNRVFSYSGYLEIMEQGMELPE